MDAKEDAVDSLKPLVKPQYLNKLEENTSSLDFCLTNGQKLSAIEIIIYIFNSLMALNGTIDIKDLYCLLKHNMNRELVAINCKVSKHECVQNLVLSNLLADMQNIFTVNQSKASLSLNCQSEQWFTRVKHILNNSLDLILRNFLKTQFQRYGRKTKADIEVKLKQDYHYMYDYLFGDQSNSAFIDFAKRYPQDFQVNEVPNGDNGFDVMIDINPDLLNERKRLNFQLKYIFGKNIYNLNGIVTHVRRDSSQISAKIKDINSLVYFKVERLQTFVYGQQVIEDALDLFIHPNDKINFNAQLLLLETEMNGNKEYSWFVTRINKVCHSGQCFLPNLNELYNRNWDQIEDNETLDD